MKINRVFFFHNTIADYRFPFFYELLKNTNYYLYITRPELSRKIYNTSVEQSSLKNCHYMNRNKKRDYQQILKDITSSDGVILPAPDSIKEIIDFLYIWISSKKSKKILFWERWRYSKKGIPLKTKLVDLFRKIIIGKKLKKLDLVLVPGNKSKEYMISLGIDEKKIRKVIDTSNYPNDVEYINIRKDHNIPNNNKIILYFGRLIERKGINNLIEVFNTIDKSDISLLICGDGPVIDEAKKKIYSNKLDNVVFAGQINSRYRKYYFEQSDVFIIPSIYLNGQNEPWGLVVNEALQAGIPVILTDVVGASDLKDLFPESIFQYNYNNLVHMKEHIENIIDNMDIQNNRSNVSKKSKENLSYDCMVKSFLDAIDKI